MRRVWPILLAAVAVLPGNAPGRSPSDDSPTSRPEIDASRTVIPAQQRAVARGLAYLARQQERDGSWGSRYAPIAVTSLCTLAFLAGGNSEDRGLYSGQVRQAVDHLLRHVETDPGAGFQRGYIHRRHDDASRLHGHAYAVLALSEAYGGARRDRLDPERSRKFREKLELAVRLIERTQEKRSGGWNYEPRTTIQHEGSVTVCQIQALRSARAVGIRIDPDVIARAVKYVRQSQAKNGGFLYALNQRNTDTYELTAAAVATLNGIGDYGSPAYRRGLDYLLRSLDRHLLRPHYFFYGNFYAAQAMWQTERRAGYWARYWPRVRARFLETESRDLTTGRLLGRWDPGEIQTASFPLGPDYGTAMACLILQIPYGYLPLFRR